ncbi:hypothetical protein BDZ94DRAFT_1252404 [Collybia nuda]|uniref:Uncharacterized protein n=1 Tax=Collybia nuda TaxID=64659 RepID=A0A9P5YBW8_9AGAR|nr:hypothetical protein BDZ94DRAFT_1252404 [Collybia nuda]
MAHEKLLRGRKLVVTFAHQAPIDQAGGPSMYGTTGVKRKGMMETGRPTTLSMLKTGMTGKNDGTKDKIAMMEAKLRQMENSNPKLTLELPSTTTHTKTGPSSSHHPSLPTKPPPVLPETHIPKQLQARHTPKMNSTLPSLPILPPPQPTRMQHKISAPRPPKMSKLAGVKIGKPKESR